MKQTMRRKPNYYAVRYYQHVMAGRVAVQTGAIDPVNPETGKLYQIYQTNDEQPNYSVIGQDYLRELGLKVTEI
jgi:hypothetical protein